MTFLKGRLLMSYDVILFDLDGTLTDSAEGIVNSVVYALERKGIPYVNKQELRRFVGPPLQDSFREYVLRYSSFVPKKSTV